VNVHIIRVDGSEEHVIARFGQIDRLIHADGLDTVNLRDGRVMVVDDLGHPNGKPVNRKATALYHGICRPGTTHQIVGDVAIVVDAEVDR